MSVKHNPKEILEKLGLEAINPGVSTGTQWHESKGDITTSYSPIDGKAIAQVRNATMDEYEMVIQKAEKAFKEWRKVPSPVRGELIRKI